jgi:HK97 gp10 family phage protein
VSITIKMEGVDDVFTVLSKLAPNKAMNLMRATIGGVASEVARDIKARVPRDTGKLRKGIKIRRRRVRRGIINVDVESKFFYWRFIEDGTVTRPARPFVGPAVDVLIANFDERFGKVFAKKETAAVNRELKKRAVK